jgi:hypothetical protein
VLSNELAAPRLIPTYRLIWAMTGSIYPARDRRLSQAVGVIALHFGGFYGVDMSPP